MKTDRELLELAARAAGKQGQVVETHRGLVFREFPSDPSLSHIDYDWLNDSWESWMLSDFLGLEVHILSGMLDDRCAVYHGILRESVVVKHDGNIRKSVMRAIVIAAAAIGEGLMDMPSDDEIRANWGLE